MNKLAIGKKEMELIVPDKLITNTIVLCMKIKCDNTCYSTHEASAARIDDNTLQSNYKTRLLLHHFPFCTKRSIDTSR